MIYELSGLMTILQLMGYSPVVIRGCHILRSKRSPGLLGRYLFKRGLPRNLDEHIHNMAMNKWMA